MFGIHCWKALMVLYQKKKGRLLDARDDQQNVRKLVLIPF